MAWTIITFLTVQALFLAVGLSASFKRRGTAEDFLVATRSVHPWLMAMASSSTNSSGFMFIGLIGATYRMGVSSMWLMVGWIVGDYVAWRIVHPSLRRRSAELGSSSVSEFIAGGRSRSTRWVRMAAATLVLVFLGTYAAAQLTAGGKALQEIFVWPEWTGVLIGATLIAGYGCVGGIRASIWTNTTQALVMISAIWMLLTVALVETGGVAGLWSRLAEIDPRLIDWRPADIKFGFFWFMLSWLMAGVGVIGQPHLMTLAMTIRSSDDIRRARPWYFVWYVVFSAGCILAGLCCRVLLPEIAGQTFDDELALPRVATQLLSPALVGVILAALFAATISTADTQIICCAAAVSRDLRRRPAVTQTATRLATFLVTFGVLCIALLAQYTASYSSEEGRRAAASVFELVVLSWSALASSLAPLMAVRAWRLPVNQPVALAMMLLGLGTALFWKYGLGLSNDVYEVLPGMAAGIATYGVCRLLGLATPASEPGGIDADTAAE